MKNNKENEKPSVGMAVVVIKDGKILIGEDTRKGEKIYGVPGGHWENGETLKNCAIREVEEECGLDCGNIKLISVYDFYRSDKRKNYITIGMRADYNKGELRDLQEEGRLNWRWLGPQEALKLNLFPPDRVLIERYLSGVVFE